MKAKIAFLKKFIEDHKVAITAGLTATAFILIIVKNQKEFNAFLDENGLTEKYYAIKE